MKKEYFELEIDVMILSQQDVVRTSDEFNKTDDPYEESGWWDWLE